MAERCRRRCLMKSAWDCGRTRSMMEVGIQPFGRENTPNLVLLGQREFGRCPSRREEGSFTRGDVHPSLSHPKSRGGTCLKVHAEEPGEAGTAGVPCQWLQDDAAQPGLGPAVAKKHGGNEIPEQMQWGGSSWWASLAMPGCSGGVSHHRDMIPCDGHFWRGDFT